MVVDRKCGPKWKPPISDAKFATTEKSTIYVTR